MALTFDDGYRDALTTAAPLLAEAGLPATFFVNTDRIDESHEGWHDEVERMLFDAASLQAIRIPTPSGPLHLELGTPEGRRQAQRALHGVLLPASAAERDAILEALALSKGVGRARREDYRVLLADEILALSRMPGMEVGSHSEHHLLLPRHPPDVQRAELARAKRSLEALLDRAVVSFAYPFGEHDTALGEIVRATPHLLAVTVQPGVVTADSDPMRLPRLEAPAEGFAVALDRLFDVGRESRGPALSVTAPVAPGAANQRVRATWTQNDQLSRHEIAAGRSVLASRPQFLIIDPSSRCNARCVMCPVSFRAPGDSGLDMPPALFETLAPLVSTASQINLFSSGEPTLAAGMVQMVGEVRRRAPAHAKICLSTNGKRLSPAFVDAALFENVGLQFSVDGGTKDVFERIRRGIRFEDLLASLRLVQERKGSRPHPMLTFSSTMSKRNIHDLANIFVLAKTYGVEHVYFYDEDPEVPEEEAFVLDESDRQTFEAQLPRIEATWVAYSNGLHFRGRRGLLAVEPPPPANPPWLTCTAPWKVLHARADGSVRTCCTLRQSMGNLTQQSIEEVWNGEAYVRLRRAFLTQSGIPGTCYRCTDPLRTWGRPAEADRSPHPA